MPKSGLETALRLYADMAGLPLPEEDAAHERAIELILARFPSAEVVERSASADVQRWARTTGLLDRVTAAGNVGKWLDHAAKAHGCTNPVRLSGTSTTVDPATGEVLDQVDTSTLPDGVMYKPCGNRREAACPACSRVYKYDTYQLIKAGLAGGKGVPASVASHPALFLTLTAPSFGPVHTRVQRAPGGPVLACAPLFRTKPVCPHGRPLYCAAKHTETDKRRGTPLCVDCYNYAAHVVWNHFMPQLWARTTIAWSRSLTKIAKTHRASVRVRFAKVAEFQHRGLVHVHALLRLDGFDPDDPTTILPPPASATVNTFREAIRSAVTATAFQTPEHPTNPSGWAMRWGKQVDVRVVRAGLPGEQLTDTHVAGYLAKYATKSTEATGLAISRLTPQSIGYYADPAGTHAARLIDAAWSLGQPNRLATCEPGPYEGLQRGAHQYGFGGHFSTKSRQYSTTLTRLRTARRTAAIRRINPTAVAPGELAERHEEAAAVVLSDWAYRGTGWLTIADQALALAAAAAARERQPGPLPHRI